MFGPSPSHPAVTPSDSNHTDFTAQLVALVDRVVRESGEPKGFSAGQWAAQFLDAPSAALGGQRPRDLVTTSEGRDAVLRLVMQMQSGAYA